MYFRIREVVRVMNTFHSHRINNKQLCCKFFVRKKTAKVVCGRKVKGTHSPCQYLFSFNGRGFGGSPKSKSKIFRFLIIAMEGTTPQRIRKQRIDFSVAEAFSHEEKFIALQTQLFSLFRYFLEL